MEVQKSLRLIHSPGLLHKLLGGSVYRLVLECNWSQVSGQKDQNTQPGCNKTSRNRLSK